MAVDSAGSSGTIACGIDTPAVSIDSIEVVQTSQQLQPVADLQASLAANGQPPVPVIAQPLMLVIVGVIALTNVARNQRFEAFHTVDVLGLVASGVCFGVAFALILRALRVGQFK